MRLRTRILIILGVIVFIAAAVFLYMRYSGQLSEQNQLRSDIAQVESILTKLVSQETDLESQLADVETRLAQANSKLNTTRAVFPRTVQSIEYHEKFFEIGDDCNLLVTSLSASAPGSVREGTKEYPINYEVTSFSVRVEGIIPETQSIYAVSEWSQSYIEGTVANILKYVNSVASGDYFVTATVESVSIGVPEPLTDARIDAMRIAIREGLTDEEKEGKTTLEIETLVEKKLVEQIRAELAKAAATINVSVYSLPR